MTNTKKIESLSILESLVLFVRVLNFEIRVFWLILGVLTYAKFVEFIKSITFKADLSVFLIFQPDEMLNLCLDFNPFVPNVPFLYLLSFDSKYKKPSLYHFLFFFSSRNVFVFCFHSLLNLCVTPVMFYLLNKCSLNLLIPMSCVDQNKNPV